MRDNIKQWFLDNRPKYELNLEGHVSLINDYIQGLGLSNEWVSVADKLPNPNQKVLTASKDGRIFYTMFLQGQVKHSFSCILSVHDHNDATHWQPLPLPPKESGE